MTLETISTVVLAEDYEKLSQWYIDTFGLEKNPATSDANDEYSYCELIRDGQTILAVTNASEMGAIPPTPRANTAIIQLYISDIEPFFKKVAENGGTIQFGPSHDPNYGGYNYGGFADIEGNPFWVVDRKEW